MGSMHSKLDAIDSSPEKCCFSTLATLGKLPNSCSTSSFRKAQFRRKPFPYNTILPCLFGSKSHYVQWVLLPDKWL